MNFAQPLQPSSDAFTPELQHAMAAYEAARIRYRAVVRASLDGRAPGASIRAAIDDVGITYFELERCRARRTPVRAKEDLASGGWPLFLARLAGFVRRALRIGTYHGELRAAR